MYMYINPRTYKGGGVDKVFLEFFLDDFSSAPRAANNCRSSDNVRLKLAHVRRKLNFDWTLCQKDFHLKIIIKKMSDLISVLSDQNRDLVQHNIMSFQERKIICSPEHLAFSVAVRISHFWVKIGVLTFLGEKSTNCSQKAGKCLNVSYFIYLASKFLISAVF